MAYLARITIYPLKSFHGWEPEQGEILPSGALRGDRQFALVDGQGRWINAKRTPGLHGLPVHIDPDLRRITVGRPLENERQFSIDHDVKELERWFSDQLSMPVFWQENTTHGFPDDTISPGPTIVSTATLETIATWFPGLTVDSIRQRFRANLEVGDVPAFWEDQLWGPEGITVPFKIKNVVFEGVNPCQRCVVPSRDPLTGEVWPLFQKQFAARREETLPAHVARERFNHFYRLTTNTRLVNLGTGSLKVGQDVRILA